MATAGELIKGSLRLLGVLAEGEEPSAASYADALTALNQMLESWSTERLSVYATQDQALTWPSGQVQRTLGPTGNLVGTRPVLLDDSTYYVVDNISYPVQLVNEDQYNDIASKANTSTLPMVLFVNMTNPNITMKIWPVPTQDIAFHFISVVPLAEPANTATTLAFPPGYLRAFRYNLALELAPEFGVVPSVDVRNIARNSKRDIKRINNPHDLMSMPTAILPRVPRFNIYAGY